MSALRDFYAPLQNSLSIAIETVRRRPLQSTIATTIVCATFVYHSDRYRSKIIE